MTQFPFPQSLHCSASPCSTSLPISPVISTCSPSYTRALFQVVRIMINGRSCPPMQPGTLILPRRSCFCSLHLLPHPQILYLPYSLLRPPPPPIFFQGNYRGRYLVHRSREQFTTLPKPLRFGKPLNVLFTIQKLLFNPFIKLGIGV